MRFPRALAVLVSIAQIGCSFITVDRAPSYAAATRLAPGVPVTCTNSNWAAGVDLVLLTSMLLIAGAAAEELDDPETTTREDLDGDSAASVFLVASVLPLSGMIYGFRTTGTCRQLKRSRGEVVGGGRDWLIPPLVIITIGAALAARPTSTPDPDKCSPMSRRTAMCRDGTVSCSTNRSGTCSWHGGVRFWYW